MVKRLALGLVVIIIALGILFITLNILDIDEDYRLHLPIPPLDTVFIFGIAVLVAYIAARSYKITGSPVILGLAGAALVFSAGRLFKGWMTGLGLDIIITVDESAALIASIFHLITAILGMSQQRISNMEFRQKSRIILGYYLGVVVCIALIILLVMQGIIPLFHVPVEGSNFLRVVARWITAFFFLVAAVITFLAYYKTHTDFYYWYSLGLVLFGFGVFFMSLGAVESRVVWLGRFAQYVGGVYFLISVLGSYRADKLRKEML
jgi:hypothetical protein